MKKTLLLIFNLLLLCYYESPRRGNERKRQFIYNLQYTMRRRFRCKYKDNTISRTRNVNSP